MLRISPLLFVLITLLPAAAMGQSASTTGNPKEGVASTTNATTSNLQGVAEPKWDFAVTTGLFEGQPHGDDDASYYGDDWYAAARLGVSVGRYWTRHFKTEVEVMTSTEGMHYGARQVITADGSSWPYGVQEYYRVSQGSARMVWQLLDNRWIHPYLLAGITLDIERQRTFVAEQYRYLPSTPGQPSLREIVARESKTGPDTVYRAGAMVGVGAKLYMSANVFANTALLVTYAKPARSVSLVIGVGVDF
jgi:hypothetical protein